MTTASKVKKAKKRWHDACLDLSVVEARFVLLQALNAHLEAVLPFVDFGLAQCDDWSFGALLSRWRSLILMKLKKPFWMADLRVTRQSSSKFDLRLSRSRALKFRTANEHSEGGLAAMADHQGRYMVFSQAFRQMDGRDPTMLRAGPLDEGRSGDSVQRIWNTQFMGNEATTRAACTSSPGQSMRRRIRRPSCRCSYPRPTAATTLATGATNGC